MDVRTQGATLGLPALGLSLDPAEARPLAWLSHAHAFAPRGPRHGRAIATPATLALVGEGVADEVVAIALGESVDLGGARLTALPAGHLPGAAQLLVERDGERLLYTGDLGATRLAGAPAAARCDHLVIESTYGLPLFHLEAPEAGAAHVRRFASTCADDGVRPVFLARALGPAHEVARALLEAGLSGAAPEDVRLHVPRLPPLGGELLPLDAAADAIVAPPSAREALRRGKVRLAWVSGHARLASGRGRFGVEELVPWSTHLDFDGLLAAVRGSGARRVDVVHGFAAPFAGLLAREGLDARAPGAAAPLDEVG